MSERLAAAIATAAAATGSEVRSGGCLCGKCRFTITGPVHDPHVCKCAHCVKRSGSPLQWWGSVPKSALTWTGAEPTWFDTYPGRTARGFCPACATHLAARDYGDDTFIGILIPALDHYADDPALIPTNLNRVAEAAPWLAQAG
ncbi:GFA family protein [Streptomyces murinus]|uniref:GFA family protein n=1 Tax=Streptomyces murinus TaxID=33900 RepID=UPI0036E25501